MGEGGWRKAWPDRRQAAGLTEITQCQLSGIYQSDPDDIRVELLNGSSSLFLPNGKDNQ